MTLVTHSNGLMANSPFDLVVEVANPCAQLHGGVAIPGRDVRPAAAERFRLR